jgi:hypothetical protein
MGLLNDLTKNNLKVDIFENFLKDKSKEFLLNPKLKQEIDKIFKIFTLGFINYTFNLDLANNMISFLEKKNKTLEEENLLLFQVVEDIIKINLELSQNCQNAGIFNNLKKSIIETTLNDKLLQIKKEDFEDGNNLASKLKSSANLTKVAKLVSRKNLNILRNLNFNQDLKRSIISKASFLQTFNELKQSAANINEEAPKSSRDNSPKNTKDRITNNNYQINIEEPRDRNALGRSNSILKTTEEKLNQIYSLREYIVKSFKDSENIKSNFSTIKNDINKLLQSTKNIITNDNNNIYTKPFNIIDDRTISSNDSSFEGIVNTENKSKSFRINSFSFSVNNNQQFKSYRTSMAEQNNNNSIGNMMNEYIETATATR